MSRGGFGGGGDTMLIHPSDVGKIIGRGGSRIRELEDMSQARIKVSRDENDNGMKTVTISGEMDQVQKAKDLIEKILDGADFGGGQRRDFGGGWGRQRDDFGGRRRDDDYGRRRDDDYGRRRDDRGGDRQFGGGRGYGGGGGGVGDTDKIYVNSADVGRIIGRAGSRIREMESESGCRIKVSREPSSDGYSSVDLTGTQDQIARAKEMIEDAGVTIVNEAQGASW